MEPSSYQKAIINSVKNDKGNILIDAKAGSGKTSTLILISEELSKQNKKSLFLAFNKNIVAELKSRLVNNGNIEVRTINSLGYSFICSYLYKKYGKDGYFITSVTESKNTTFFVKQYIMDNFLDILRESREDISGDEKLFKNLINSLTSEASYIVDFVRFYFIDHKNKNALENFISTKINQQKVINLLDENNKLGISDISLLVETVIDNMINKFLNPEYNTETNTYDFEIEFKDQVFFPLYFNMSIPYSLQSYLEYILIDEDQDLSIIQQLLVKKLYNYKNTRYIFVGDEKQAIYGFSGADTSSVDNIKHNFRVKELPLNICYRCPEKIVRLAKQLVPEIEWNKYREDKGKLVVINRNYLDSYIQNGDMILSRKNKILLEVFIEEVLHNRRKMRFCNIKLVNSIIKDVNDSINEYIKRYNKCLNIESKINKFLEDKQIPKSKVKRNTVQNTEVQNYVKELMKLEKQNYKNIIKKKFTLYYLFTCMQEYKDYGSFNYVLNDNYNQQYEDDMSLVEYYDVIQSFISEFLKDKYNKNLNYCLEHCKENLLEKIKLDEFIDYFENFLQATNYEKENCPVLSTIHQMKGDEADRVFILDYPDFPYYFKNMTEDDIQQEKNLQYVAITRAKKELYLVLIDEKSNSLRSTDTIEKINEDTIESLTLKFGNDIELKLNKSELDNTEKEVNEEDLENSLKEAVLSTSKSANDISNKVRYGTIKDVEFIEDN